MLAQHFSCKSRNNQTQYLINKLLNWSLHVLLLITLICILVPFSPWMPGEGLDPSWVFGVHQAVAQGLSFGRALIFTFGPYASIYTQMYHPATDLLMLVGSTYLAVSYWIAFAILIKNNYWHFVLAFLVLIVATVTRDALLYTYPLLAGLACFNLINSPDGIKVKDKYTLALTIVLFFPFGLLLLIKGSILLLCGLIAGTSFILFLINKRWYSALAVMISPICATLFFWTLSGQFIFDLPGFFASLSSIISGYTEAMAWSNNSSEVIAYLIASAFLLITVPCEKSISIKSKWILFFMYFTFLFMAFKGGFVRHDAHAILAGSSILITALLALLLLKSRQMVIVLFISTFTSTFIIGHYTEENLFKRISPTYSSAWNGFKNRLINPNRLNINFNDAVQLLKEKARFPVFTGTTDIYSFNQSYLIASGNVWNPRPVLQSYSAYTPNLIKKNKDHLLGATSPDNIIFRVEPIDGRLPALEDGASWPVLLSRYEPVVLENDFLFLRKRTVKSEPLKLLLLSEGTYKFGERVAVPNTTTPLFAEITISPTLLGQLAKIIFKPTQLQISLHLHNNTSKSFRMIASMAETGLVLSPLIESTAEFGLLYGKKGFLQSKQVKSFSIQANAPGGVLLWKESYQVTFKKIKFPLNLESLS